MKKITRTGVISFVISLIVCSLIIGLLAAGRESNISWYTYPEYIALMIAAIFISVFVSMLFQRKREYKKEHKTMECEISKQQKIMEEITRRTNELEAASKAKGDFLSAMSHEMRTPMNTIIGMTAIGRKTKDIEEKNHAFKKIGDASSHLLGVINDILDMAKIEADKLELSSIEYDFERMLQKVVEVVNFRLEEKEQKLSVKIDENIPRFVIGDDQRMAQVIMNLMSNAIKFTPKGGKIFLEVSLAGEINGNCELRIAVIDSGIGIAVEQQKLLFRAFEQIDSGKKREYGGTGLGLSISKRIVELMDGRIWVESQPGHGSKFIFTAKVLRGEKNARSVLPPNINWETMRILAVDDMPDIRNQFLDIFGQLHIHCDVAADGFEACRIIKERGGYDIYFIDWLMPGMDGIELTRQIKACSTEKPSVVIMTAMDWEKIKSDAANAGVDKHLIKPLFTPMIIDCVSECLSRASVMPENIDYADNEFLGKKMLLVEDLETNREVLKKYLENTGLEIDTAENGQIAVEIMEAAPRKYNIVFMDIEMPKMDGLEATRRIRALPGRRRQGERVPIIAMTANVFKNDIEKCLEAGMDGHLGKPIDIDRVLEVLRKHLHEINNAVPAANRTRKVDTKWTTQFFIRDASKAIVILDAISRQESYKEDLHEYILYIHGIKSALAEMGENELSGVALNLEKSGRNNDIDALIAETPMFISSLQALVEKLTPDKDETGSETAGLPGDETYLQEKLLAVSEACQGYNVNAAEEIMVELLEKAWPHETVKMLNEIHEHLLFSNFDEIIGMVNNYKKG